MVERATAVVAQYAKTVRIVDHQPGFVFLAQREQCRQRCDIAIHRKHAVGHHQASLGRAGGQQLFERIDIAVWIYLHCGTRQACAVDQRRMIERLRKNRRIAAAQRGQHGHVRHVAAAEIQRARRFQMRCHEGGQPFFQHRMRARMAADQMRCATADAIARCTFTQRLDHTWMIGKAEIIVAAKGEHRAAIDGHARCASRVRIAAMAAQVARIECLQILIEFCE